MLLTSISLFSQTGDDGLYFNGTSDGIIDITSNSINSQTTRSRTYELSFKVDDVNSTDRQILMTEGGGDRGVQIYVEDGYLIAGAYNNAAVEYLWTGTFYRKAISSDTWYHMVFVLDGTGDGGNTFNTTDNDDLKFYLGEVGVSNATLIGDIAGYSIYRRNVLSLGYRTRPARYSNCGTWTTDNNSEYCFNSSTRDSNQATDPFYFAGYIYFFRIWDDVRTLAEMTTNQSTVITTVGTDDLIAAINSDGLTYEDNNGNPVEVEAEPAPDDEIAKWTGATNTNWNTLTNWEDGKVPETDIIQQEIIIQASALNDPIIDASNHITAFGDITIENGANITVNNGSTLEVEFDLINNGTLNIENGGSLILRNTNSATGTFNVTRTTPTYSSNDFYSYWSSPVVASDSDIATVFSDAELIYQFDANSALSDWVLNGTTDFEPGIGYAVQNEGTGGQTRTFTGIINNGNIEVDVHDTTNKTGTDGENIAWSTEGDNLVGNPYPSAIDWDLVSADTDNTDIDGTIYIWDQTTAVGANNVSEYKQYNLTGGSDNTTTSSIGTGQGFFVRTSIDNASITFKPSHQIEGSNTTFFRTANNVSEKKKGRSWLKFIKEDKINTLLIGFVEGATKNYDRLYDAPFDTDETSLGFYSILEESEKASIQGLPKLNSDEEIVQIGFVVDQIGEYTIDIQKEYIDENYNILLHDTEKDVTVNLRESQYNFTIDNIGENNSRFEVIYSQTDTLTQKEQIVNKPDDELFININNDKELIADYISDTIEIAHIDLYNIQGEQVMTFSTDQTKTVSTLTNGVYIVHVTLTNNLKLTRKIIVAN